MDDPGCRRSGDQSLPNALKMVLEPDTSIWFGKKYNQGRVCGGQGLIPMGLGFRV